MSTETQKPITIPSTDREQTSKESDSDEITFGQEFIDGFEQQPSPDNADTDKNNNTIYNQ